MAQNKEKFGKGNFNELLKAAGKEPIGTERTESEEAQPASRGRAPGKRSDPDWGRHSILLKRSTHIEAVKLIMDQQDGTDLSDLIQKLLEEWVKTQKNEQQ